MDAQRTIEREISLTGVNVYNGRQSTVTISPAEPDTGLVFRVNGSEIPATLKNAYQSSRSVFLRNSDSRGPDVGLVEHLLAALFYGLDVDNARIGLRSQFSFTWPPRTAAICPTFDSATREYVQALSDHVVQQDVPRTYATLSERIGVTRLHRTKPDRLELNPTEDAQLTVTYTAGWSKQGITDQTKMLIVTPDSYAAEVARARPPAISFLSEGFIVRMTRAGFVGLMPHHGVTPNNYQLTRADDRYNGMEPVSHKLIDLLGELALLGVRLQGVEIKAYKTGHAFDLAALQEISPKLMGVHQEKSKEMGRQIA